MRYFIDLGSAALKVKQVSATPKERQRHCAGMDLKFRSFASIMEHTGPMATFQHKGRDHIKGEENTSKQRAGVISPAVSANLQTTLCERQGAPGLLVMF